MLQVARNAEVRLGGESGGGRLDRGQPHSGPHQRLEQLRKSRLPTFAIINFLFQMLTSCVK